MAEFYGLLKEPGVHRQLSPDGRLALETTFRRFDHDGRAHPAEVVLSDAATDAVLARFAGRAMLSDYEWLDGGGVDLAFTRRDWFRVASDLATFVAEGDVEARPIGTLQAWVDSRWPGPSPSSPARRRGFWFWRR